MFATFEMKEILKLLSWHHQLQLMVVEKTRKKSGTLAKLKPTLNEFKYFLTLYCPDDFTRRRETPRVVKG